MNIPLGIRFGKIVKLGKRHYNVFIEPFYNIQHGDSGDLWGIKIDFTLLLPGMHL